MNHQIIEPASTTEAPAQKRRFSLKWKWALGTSAGVLIIFFVFAFVIFNSFATVLMRQERSHVTSTLQTVVSRFDNHRDQLTASDVSKTLTPTTRSSLKAPNRPKNNVYSDSLTTSLAQENIAVGVFDTNGKLLFQSRPDPVSFSRSSEREVQESRAKGANRLIARSPIRATDDHNRIIGYVQVTDELSSYHATTSQLALILFVTALIVGLINAIFAYMLASYLLRPIDDISHTIHEINEETTSEARVPVTRRNDELADLGLLFNDMIDQMQRYIEQQQQFVEDVSHELRTPVAIIQGHMELLQRWGKDDPEVLNESLDASLQETKRMQNLVQEMLDLSRAEQIEVTFNNEVSNVNQIVNQVFNDFKMIHPEFLFILDDDTREEKFAQIYRNHLEQVLIILLDNAVKYSVNRKEIHLTLENDTRNVVIAIQDFGEGISQENMDRVFNRFYRVDKARSRNKGGNGLGLSIAKRLIEAYHGGVAIESAVGQGSVFRISLPFLTEEQREALENRPKISDELPPSSLDEHPSDNESN